MTIISLFDGMSCGRIALERAGIKVDKYYASEIDKYAIQVAKKNYPDIIHIGDVSKLRVKKRSSYVLLIDEFDNKHKIEDEILLIGGSPCQGFSFAGKREGAITECKIEITTLEQYLELKEQSFKFSGQSYLFWEYIRIKNNIQPKHFLLENVMMVNKWKDMFNKAVGVEPIMINSSLVSAQNRKRLYWTDINIKKQPRDRKIFIKDILEDEVDEKYYLSKDYKLYNQKSQGNKLHEDKTSTLCAGTHGYCNGYVYDKPKRVGDIGSNAQAHRVYSTDGKSVNLTANGGGQGAKTGLYLVVPEATKQGYAVINDGECFDATQPNSKTRRGRNMSKKSNCLTTSHQYMKYEGTRIRKLTPLECERLQTVPDNYTSIVSDTQRYKMLGNGWTVKVIEHIFKGLRNEI